MNHDSLDFSTTIYPDPYDKTDSIVYAKVVTEYFDGISMKTDTISMKRTGKNNWSIKIKKVSASQYNYRIIARNLQGLSRETPFYIVKNSITTGINDINHWKDHFTVFPNPASSEIHIRLLLSNNKNVDLELSDLSGKLIAGIYHGLLLKGTKEIIYDTGYLSKGFYFVIMNTDMGYQIEYFIKN
jgi:hypothetical protein